MNTSYLYNFELEDSSLQIYYYEDLKEKLESIIYRLNRSLNYLDNINASYDNNCSVDEYNSDNFEEVRNEISSRINYIKYTIIPAIKQKMNGLS